MLPFAWRRYPGTLARWREALLVKPNITASVVCRRLWVSAIGAHSAYGCQGASALAAFRRGRYSSSSLAEASAPTNHK